MTISWFLSKTVRQLADMCRQMKRVLNEQRDLLSGDAIAAIESARNEALGSIRKGAGKEELKKQMGKLEEAARRWFKPYPSPAVRENVKEFLVAVVTILSFTTFFLQLTKIPTGSMQPTLFGITYQDLAEDKHFQLPSLWKRLALFWTQGISYKYLEAPFDGYVVGYGTPQSVFPFVKRQPVDFQGVNSAQRKRLWIWFPPDEKLFANVRDVSGRMFRKGEAIVQAKSVAGDHLLVDRFTYNWRRPERGEIFVFKTKGIQDSRMPQDVLYIKRLVGLPNEDVKIGNDRHLIINGEKLDAGTPRFERVYEFDLYGKNRPYAGAYKGHVNDLVAQRLGYPSGSLAPLFPDENVGVKTGPREYLAMGDNTLNSWDSRGWGVVPQKNIIGKCWFVYWPFTDRFGWGYR